MITRFLLSLCAAFFLALGTPLIVNPVQAASVDALRDVQQRGELRAATEGTWAPWTYHDATDTLTGFDVEVLRRVAQQLGVRAVFAETPWNGLLAGLDARRWDIAANGVEITAERANKYIFSLPYAYIRTALIVRSDNASIRDFADLRGKRTANSLASTYMTLAESYGAESLGVDSLGETLEMVLSGRVDATLNADVSFFDYMRAHPDAPLKIVALTSDAVQVAFPLRREAGTDRLLHAVNTALEHLRVSGELSTLSQQFFGADITTQP